MTNKPRGSKKPKLFRPGRYPFMTAANAYLERRKGFLQASTLKENERKLRYLSRVFTDLKRQGLVSTTYPANMVREDIQAFMVWMKEHKNMRTGEQGLDPETQAKYLHLLDKVCLFSRNPVIQQMKEEGERLPSAGRKDLTAIDEEDLRQIQEAASTIGGWRGEVTQFLVWTYPYTGLRPSELRLAHVDDIDVRKWTIHVRHPKGEGSYGNKRTVPILPPARPAVVRYLKAREEHLVSKGIVSVALIPKAGKGRKGEFYSANAFYIMKSKVERISGIKFRIKDFRSTYAQMNIDRDPSLLPDVSKFMGHATTKTTEEHYGRIKDQTAFLRVERAWESPMPQNGHKDSY
jgi:integrase